jgi:hypothetical protein
MTHASPQKSEAIKNSDRFMFLVKEGLLSALSLVLSDTHSSYFGTC